MNGHKPYSSSELVLQELMGNSKGRVLLTIVTASETQKLYLALKQPPFNPPGWVFGPVWTALYATMGYVAHRAWTAGTTSVNPTTVNLAKQGGE